MIETANHKRLGRPPRLTPEEKEATRVRQNRRRTLATLKRRSERRAAKAIAEGREPGKTGGVRRLSDEERVTHRRQTCQKFRERHLDKRKPYEAAWHRNKRAAKAIAEGREPGIIGRIAVLTDAQRLERARKSSLRYAKNNPEKVRDINNAYYASHKEETAVRVRNRRARVRNSQGSHSKADIKRLYVMQKGKCSFCLMSLGNEKTHVDHYIPIVLGGSNDPSNLRLLHGTCNRRKGGKHPIDFGLQHGLLLW